MQLVQLDQAGNFLGFLVRTVRTLTGLWRMRPRASGRLSPRRVLLQAAFATRLELVTAFNSHATKSSVGRGSRASQEAVRRPGHERTAGVLQNPRWCAARSKLDAGAPEQCTTCMQGSDMLACMQRTLSVSEPHCWTASRSALSRRQSCTALTGRTGDGQTRFGSCRRWGGANHHAQSGMMRRPTFKRNYPILCI